MHVFTTTLHNTVDSIPKLDALLELIRLQMPGDEKMQTSEGIRLSLTQALRPGRRAKLVLLSETHTAEPVGFAFFNIGSGLESGGDYIWLNEIHIAERFRGQGAGRKMVEALTDWARENRIKAIYGVCGTENQKAQAFYEGTGFSTEEVVWISKPLET